MTAVTSIHLDADVELDARLCAAHPELPGLATLLDDDALSALLGTVVRADRLRVKSGSSARVSVVDATGRWTVVQSYAPGAWVKATKDLSVARRDGQPIVLARRERIVAVPAAADRRLRAVARWRPDTGRPPRRRAIDTMSWAVIDGADRRTTRVRTLAHNPARRWVGALDAAGVPTGVVKVFARPADAVTGGQRAAVLAAAGIVVTAPAAVPGLPGTQVMPWIGGRPAGGPDAAAVGAIVARLGRIDPSTVPPAELALDTALVAAADALGVLDPHWARRARDVLGTLGRRGLTRPAREVVAHGDLSPDQIIVGAGAMTLLDLDRCGHAPAGWDAASWIAAQLATDAHLPPAALPGHHPDPWTLAVTSLLRAPEPFRRRRRGRVAATEALLAAAESAVGIR